MVSTEHRPRAAARTEIERLSGALASAFEHDPVFGVAHPR
jgi:hypothetical protein